MPNLDEPSIQIVTDASGEKFAVILPIEQFHQLVEDMNDLAIIAQRGDESTISRRQLINELHPILR